MIKTGIIGSGNMAQDLSRALNTHGQFFIKTICDIDEEKGQRLADTFACRFKADYQELLKDPEIDFIYIATPPKTHAEIFIKSLKAFKHTLLEKPLCMNEDEARKMEDVALEARHLGIISAINYPMAFIPAMFVMKKLLQDEELGSIRHIEIKLNFPMWPRPKLSFNKGDWINGRDSGGILREIGSHYLYALDELFPKNPIKRVCALIDYPKNSAETGASAILEQSLGLGINLSLAANFSGPREELHLRIYGSKKTLSLENFQILKIACAHEELTLHPCCSGIDEDAFMSSVPLVNQMASAIKKRDANNLVSITAGARVQKVLSAILASEGVWRAI